MKRQAVRIEHDLLGDRARLRETGRGTRQQRFESPHRLRARKRGCARSVRRRRDGAGGGAGKKFLTAAQLDEVLQPELLTRPGYVPAMRIQAEASALGAPGAVQQAKVRKTRD